MPPLPHVILPGTDSDLLRRELALAFAAQGCQVSVVAPGALHDPASPDSLSELLGSGPVLLFSVNFQGLGSLRQTVELLDRAGGRIAVWCVDNPWNLLSGVRDPRWKTLALFVTDASFLAPLRAHGAERVAHLPLAVCPESFAPNEQRETAFPPPEDLAPLVFVGRSAFPGKATFFAGQHIPPKMLKQALELLPEGGRPDLLWWEQALNAPVGGFWPGKKARLPALGAEESNLAWRALCLAEAASLNGGLDGEPGLDIIGDSGWTSLLPTGARLHPPVDYYASLPGIYRRARYSLCLTSLQLPQGLNQRHFDIWAAGGVCLSDATPGLACFPHELTKPTVFIRPRDLESTVNALERGNRSALVAAWREHLWERHTYAHRVRLVLEKMAYPRDAS